ncbi:MAG: guanylate kinase [Candidatus Peregrinibacteria bacterium]|nr:guanylate kinase [Candidatus Peregrinibacteria bacterium]
MKGKLFLLVGPSGSGKSSVLHELKSRYPEFVYPLSATTRAMREGEVDGDIYNFYTKEQFKEGIENDEFLEWAIVHQDNYYGLIKGPIMENLEAGKTIVREVDIQGFDSIRDKIAKEDLITIFITVPNKAELIERIVNRATISQDELEKRKESMHKEFNRARDCDYMVENVEDKLEETVDRVAKIIESETKE